MTLPRTAHAQFHTGTRVPDGSPLLPGDLIFYGTPANISHVALDLGNGKMINAPTFGSPSRSTTTATRMTTSNRKPGRSANN
uniref:C40 family peptidase n=1 Tax=Amycolatopsis viridis TaxID=185678 RepID=UPI0036F2DC53